jgi:hypothetical protein
MHDGWIGDVEQLEHYLSVVKADKDHEGKFKVWGTVTVGIGGQEAVVHGDAEYAVDGHRCNLAAGLRSTSYGVGVKVFYATGHSGRDHGRSQ